MKKEHCRLYTKMTAITILALAGSFIGFSSVEAADIQVTNQDELISVIENGGTAILQNNISMSTSVADVEKQVVQKDKDVTINTNGYTITLDNAYIGAKGKLTINGGGNIIAGSEYVYDRVISGSNGAVINISNITVNAGNNSLRVAYFENVNLNIENSTFTGGYNDSTEPCAGVEITGVSEAVLNNVNVYGNTYAGTLDESKGYLDAATDIWFGAQVVAEVNNGNYGNIFANQNKYSAESSHPGKVVINNGTFKKVWVEYYEGYTANVIINNGLFSSFVIVDHAKPVINGGTFTEVVLPTGLNFNEFITEGSSLVSNNDGTFTVSKEETTTKNPVTVEPTTVKPEVVTTVVVDKKLKFQQRRTRFGYIKNKKSCKILIRISKVDTAKGYVLKISTSKKFSKKKTKTITIKKKRGMILYTMKNAKLGKVYHIRARAYTVIKGKKVYAKWTAKRQIKIKK